jgi:hypothetical protein
VTPPDLTRTVTLGRYEYVEVDRLLPAEARALMLDDVLAAFADAGVNGFVVKSLTGPDHTVGVPPGQRAAALDALARALPGPGRYLQESYPATQFPQALARLTPARVAAVPGRCPIVHVGRFWSVCGDALRYGMDYGVRIEFWTDVADDPETVAAPVANAAAQYTHRDYLAPATITVEGQERPSIALFDRTFLDEVDFPIDAVYTWVDGGDPAWRERMQRARAEAEGVGYHPEAQAANRYQSRDELRYSLRSLEMYAPWIRHIFLVTDQQVPQWLDAGNDRISVVDHRDIFSDPDALPLFNSSGIITQLHHIDGLAEHYLFLNDDMFFGRDVTPDRFWFGNGIAKVFRSRLTRPFGPPHAGDAPHFNITKNIRGVLEAELGRSVSTAIRHTPYPQLRSVNYEIEERFGEAVGATAHQRFRHHLDIAQDQLFHYYAQATGHAVPSNDLAYGYINVGVAESVHRLRRLLAARDRETFCLNDAPEPGSEPVPVHEIAAFLDAYFPFRSSFEKPG